MTGRRLAILLACALPTCTARESGLSLPDVQGSWHAVLPVPAGSVHVFVFTSHECPIANSYAPTLRTLATSWTGQPIQLFVVQCGPNLTPAAARQHAQDYELPGQVLLDPTLQLAHRVGATRTPEAVVLLSSGVAYRGRIDDQWAELGARRAAASQNDLAEAVARARHGETTPEPHPPAIGCWLPEPAPR